MKKFIISILILMFFAVSCNSSKKTENDTDLLPDEDEINDEETEADVDENDEEVVEPDEESDEEQNNSDEDEIMNIDPCDPNPCVGIENSTEKCRASGVAKYSCGCVEGYFWEGKKCVESPCNAEPCKNHEHSNNRCEPRDKQTYICGCIEGYWWWGQNKGCLDKKPDIANICTNQTKCYNKETEIDFPKEGEDFFGQDAQYADMGFCAPHNFSIDDSVENEPTVIDLNTGLEWQQMFSDSIEMCVESFDESACSKKAEAYCKTLNYGGHNDWRLPTILELYSIVDNEKYDPAIDIFYFPGTPSERFLTSSISEEIFSSPDQYGNPDISTLPFVWRINFAEGSTSETDQFFFKGIFFIRCVRGEEALPEKKFDVMAGSDSETKIIFDSKGNLIWQDVAQKSLTWEEALKYCETLKLAGLSNWRLPNKTELLNTFPPCKSYYANTNITDINTAIAWSSSSFAADPENAWLVKHRTDTNGLCSDNAWLTKYGAKTISAKHFYTRCVTENPCSKGEVWNGETCIANKCDPNPCKQMLLEGERKCVVTAGEEAGYYCK